MAHRTQAVTSTTTLQPSQGKPQIQITGSPALIEVIAHNHPFPATLVDVPIGQLQVAAHGPSFDLPGIGAAPVVFNISSSKNAALAAYQTAGKIESDLGFADAGKPLQIGFPPAPGKRYMVLRWGFDASLSAAGTMALNPSVSLNFGGSGNVEDVFAFVSTVNVSMPAGDAFLNLLNAWCTPGAVSRSPAALSPGCWIITEVTGQLTANLGVDAGYDFNWVKSLSPNTLDGDIGLRVSLGLQAVITASLGSKFYLVLSRESVSSGIRLRLFRAKTKGWGFALHSGVQTNLLLGSQTPADLDSFILAVLGIHDAQLLRFLEASNLSDITDGLGGEFLAGLGLGQDVDNAFAKLQNLFLVWDNLPNAVTTVIWNQADRVAALTAIRDAALEISQLSEASIQALLDSWLHDVAFMNNPVGQWLEAAASTTLFDLYESNQLAKLRDAANRVAALLDGADLQDLLTKLKNQVDKFLNLPSLEAALNANDLSGVSVWVTQQLARFLGIDLSQLKAGIGKINAVIANLRKHAPAIFAATEKALNNTYGFSLDYAYSASTTDSALLDIQFADTASPHLAAAIQGDFTSILANPIPGVILRKGTLTHAIERHSHVETHFPWWKGAADDLAQGHATGTFVDGQDGRVQFYEAGASDVVTRQADTNLKRFASCSIGISGQAVGVRKYNVAAVDFGYSFVTARANMTTSQLEYDFAGAADQYFPNAFGDESPDSNHANFKTWVSDWDKFTDPIPGMPAGDGVIGNTWVNLQIRSRASSGTDWVSALMNNTHPPNYRAMSMVMQQQIRRWLLKAYAADPSRFQAVPSGKNPVAAFLVYTALPPANDYRYDGHTLAPNPGGDIVWDVGDPELAAAVTKTFAPAPLQSNLRDIHGLLNGIPNLRRAASSYGSAASIVNDLLLGLAKNDAYMLLLARESAVIAGAKEAFEGLRRTGGLQLQDSLPSFSSALVNLVVQFGSALGRLSLDAPQVMRLFAPLVFQSAVEAMFPGLQAPVSDALFDLAVLKGTAPLPGTDQQPVPDQILLRQRITSFS